MYLSDIGYFKKGILMRFSFFLVAVIACSVANTEQNATSNINNPKPSEYSKLMRYLDNRTLQLPFSSFNSNDDESWLYPRGKIHADHISSLVAISTTKEFSKIAIQADSILFNFSGHDWSKATDPLLRDLLECLFIIEEYPHFLDIISTLFNEEENRERRHGYIQNLLLQTAGPGMDALAFWHDRKKDGTFTKTAQLLIRLGELRIAPWIKKTQDKFHGNRENIVAFPVFFDSHSFLDIDVESVSILDVRSNLLQHFFQYVDSAMKRVNDNSNPTSIKITDNKLLSRVQDWGSHFFHEDLHNYGLFAEGAGYEWRQVVPELSLSINAYEYCDGPVPHVYLKVNSGNKEALLYAGLPKEIQPTGYFVPEALEQKDSTLGSADNNTSQKIRVFSVPKEEKRFKKLILTEQFTTMYMNGPPLTLLASLQAVMQSGDTLQLYRQTSFGHHSPNSARVALSFFCDCNGDGLWDLVFESSSQSRLLLLQLPYGGFEIRNIRNFDLTGSGGC